MLPDWAAVPTPVPYAEFSDPQSLNLYVYVRNNPLNKADVDGHCTLSECFHWAAQGIKDISSYAGRVGYIKLA